MRYNEAPVNANETCCVQDSKALIYSHTCFAKINDNIYVGALPSIPAIPSGIYRVKSSDQFGCEFHNMVINADDYMPFSMGTVESILSDIDNFWTKKDVYTQLGFVHRRGFMLYGPQGTGKSTLVYQACDRFISKYSGIVILVSGVSPALIQSAMTLLRQVDPHRKLMVVFEDLDDYVKHWGEEALLNMLDGESTITDCVIIATTNYIHKLDQRIACRPRRFDRLLRIDSPTDEIRAIYFKNKLNIDDAEVSKYVEHSKDFTFAAMAELVISVKALGLSLEEAATTLKNILSNKASTEPIGTERSKTAGLRE